MNVKLIVMSSIAVTVVLVAVGYFFLAPGEEPISNKPYHHLKKKIGVVDEMQDIEYSEAMEDKDVSIVRRKHEDVESPEEKVRTEYKNISPED